MKLSERRAHFSLYRLAYVVLSLSVTLFLGICTLILVGELNQQMWSQSVLMLFYAVWSVYYWNSFRRSFKLLTSMAWFDDFVYLVCRKILVSANVCTIAMLLWVKGMSDSASSHLTQVLVVSVSMLLVSFSVSKLTSNSRTSSSKERFEHMMRAVK
ncbi:hypothetical protein INR79_23920 [Vibrio sp. SCSIO 43132]|uniref:hypothetical protein n=1 Tax=Vibrio sp. SCSIO 43132 TaxID=2779363 RepID=UPI001CA8ED42|nr:hypothetical protein [Vibrio sp. SCSIO 43132]UAB72309.1 hypothetical protein INR79_23920 [Vibrio sp. SCSIO 43132]